MLTRHALLLAGCMIGAGALADPAPADGGKPSSAEAGRALFNSIGCWACHGFSGQGGISGGMAGPQIVPLELPFDAFAHFLRHPASRMPPYGPAVLSDQQVEELYAYIKSLPPSRHRVAPDGAKKVGLPAHPLNPLVSVRENPLGVLGEAGVSERAQDEQLPIDRGGRAQLVGGEAE